MIRKIIVTTITNLNGKRGIELLQDPALNKSTAFTEAEKQALGLVGLVPMSPNPKLSNCVASCSSSDIKAPISIAISLEFRLKNERT